MPWRHFTSPFEKWAVQPSFLVGEYLFILCAAVALFHAKSSGRKYLLVWVAALVAGTANDLIFMSLPLVDNFWHAQATVMITARLPLYIPCVYVCFMYYPTVAVWRLGLPPIARAAATGLLTILFYAPYDIVGAKFLWWTWHETDGPIANRLLGVPIGSSLWAITFVAGFSYLLNRIVDRDPSVRLKTALLGIGVVAALCSLAMVIQVTALQQLDEGVPGIRGLVALVTLYLGVAGWGYVKHRRSAGEASGFSPAGPADRILLGAVVAYYLVFVTVLAIFKPEEHVSLSVHQTFGPCHVLAKDITGKTRDEFLCADTDPSFGFDRLELPEMGSRWYAVRGRPHRDFAAWMLGVSTLALLGAAAFAALLAGRDRSRKAAGT